MGDLKYLLPILVAVVLLWITYLIINFVATIIKTKKKMTQWFVVSTCKESILWCTYRYLLSAVCVLCLFHDYPLIKW